MANLNSVEDWKKNREDVNVGIMNKGNRNIKRFFNLDTAAYIDGALPAKTKELLGLSASMVLRCDDCITYHIIQAVLAGATDEELYETFNVALIVGGSIVIPHLRRAASRLEECRELEKKDPKLLSLEKSD
ncbi:carboxymuconolactone decarboxylase family protein [Promethearchaeum syntrophicum]|uniref:Carboxymuconolactone decarboxylase family protein n=1 Tax=Promethearchaeum syntrophicum TaxID=2594042 RepID=A0A5B9DAP1_9ARCH|nr:carboxymuconolactone decarboxylase family protein [Candidatus Prometheoarchaeum syntrophicum]QEE15887.1 Carboxymuconolactone decarboxylase family protein [Candidatus Prometheoarchaeum syntrophicum]